MKHFCTEDNNFWGWSKKLGRPSVKKIWSLAGPQRQLHQFLDGQIKKLTTVLKCSIFQLLQNPKLISITKAIENKVGIKVAFVNCVD